MCACNCASSQALGQPGAHRRNIPASWLVRPWGRRRGVQCTQLTPVSHRVPRWTRRAHWEPAPGEVAGAPATEQALTSAPHAEEVVPRLCLYWSKHGPTSQERVGAHMGPPGTLGTCVHLCSQSRGWGRVRQAPWRHLSTCAHLAFLLCSNSGLTPTPAQVY